MNLKKLFVLFVSTLVLLSGCSKPESDTPFVNEEEFLFEKDMNTEVSTDSAFARIAPSSEGIYFITGEYLYFYDYATSQTVFLCNKPNCKHNKETDQAIGQECNAYTQNGSYGGMLSQSHIVYHDGYLYSEQTSVNFQTGGFSGEDIMKIEKDGSNREVIYHIDSPYFLNTFIVHRDNLIFALNNELVPEQVILQLLDLNDLTKEPKTLLPDNVGRVSYFFAKDNYLYLRASEYIDDEGKEHYNVIGRLDLDLEDFTMIIEDADPLISSFAVLDDDVYIYAKERDTYVYNAATKENIRLCDEAGHVAISKDLIFVNNGFGRFHYEEGQKTVSVFDRGLNHIDTYELEEGSLYCDSGIINDELFYFNKTEDGSIERIYRLFLNDEGKLESAVFSEVYPSENKMGGYVTYNE